MEAQSVNVSTIWTEINMESGAWRLLFVVCRRKVYFQSVKTESVLEKVKCVMKSVNKQCKKTVQPKSGKSKRIAKAKIFRASKLKYFNFYGWFRVKAITEKASGK